MGVSFARIGINVFDTGHITNSYVIYDTKTSNAILIDPADKADYIMNKLDELKLTLKVICLTHCHFDHIGALEELYKKTNAIVYIHENDKDGIFDNNKNCNYIVGEKTVTKLKLEDIVGIPDEYEIDLDSIELKLIHTPGHTDGGAIFYLKNLNILFTGDTVFSDCYGRTDLKSGNDKEMLQSLQKVFKLYDDIKIYPGHGESCNIEEAKRKINLIIAMKETQG